MLQTHAFDTTLIYDGTTVDLKPSLRAATDLERLHDGFPALLQRVQDFNLSTIRMVIRSAATDQKAANNFLAAIKDAPLAKIREATTAQIFMLLTALMMPTSAAPNKTTKVQAKPVAWGDVFADLYKIATGWLGWTPAQAWAATLTEITNAFDGLIDKLRAIHGDADNEVTGGSPMSAEQRRANIDAGLDPEFNRSALSKMKQRIASKAANP